MTQAMQASRPVFETTTTGFQAAYYRLVSITRLPAAHGKGVTNLASLYHDQEELQVTWQSQQVDCRLKRGCLVSIRGRKASPSSGDAWRIQRLELLEKPLPGINPFATIPGSWVRDRTWIARVNELWQRLSRSFQHLLTAVFWDARRFERFLTGPAALSSYRPLPNANLRHAVELAEQAYALAQGLRDVTPSVVITSALLHDAGKADDYRLTSERDGYAFSERGLLVGYRHTVLEWLAVARGRDGVIVPDSQYLALVHALTATPGTSALGIREPQTIEASILNIAHRVSDEPAWPPIDPQAGRLYLPTRASRMR